MKLPKRYYLLLTGLLLVSIAFAQKNITIRVNNVSPEILFKQIEEQSGYTIYCNPQDVDSIRLSLQCENVTAEEGLNKAFEDSHFKVSVFEDKYIFLLKEKQLITELPNNYFRKTPLLTDGTDMKGSLINPLKQKATSENKVYIVGDENQPEATGKVTLSGIITDFKTGEPIVGAVIYTEESMTASTTDAYGSYSLQIPAGRQRLLIRGVGLKDTQRQVVLYDDGKLDIELEEQIYSLQEVTVTSRNLANVQSTTLGVERITIKDIKNIPSAFGEVDVMRVVMMLPGVKAVGEASSGFNVRGGSTDQNLVLFNGGTIYNPTHLFGFFSAFNSDLVKDIELYKSSIPSKYGGRISSVLEINAKEGNKKEFTGSVSLGLLTSRITLEGPIGSNTSFIAGGRTTYSDWLLNLLPEKSGYKDGNAGFYDLNLILDHKFSDKDNLYLSAYYSHDRFKFDENERYGYANASASAKWKHLFSDKLIAIFTGGYDHYDYKTYTSENPIEAYLLTFDINQFFGKIDFTSYLNDKHTLDFGAGSIYYLLNPGKYMPNSPESLVKPDIIQKEKAFESSVHIADRWDITPELSINAGVRVSLFNAMGPRTYNIYDPEKLPHELNVIETKETRGFKPIKTYYSPEIRLSARYAFNNDLSVKAGVNTLGQFIHKLSNTTIMSPTDTWKLSDANIKPQKGMQVAVGVYKNFMDNLIETSIEGYYKSIKDYLDYRSGAQLTMNHTIETDVISTKGKAYGIELMLKKAQGKLNGWVSYTYSKTLLKQDNPLVVKPVNNGDWYPADYDKPHELKFTSNYKFTQRYSISLNCEYSTGRPITLPTSKYEYADGEFVFYSDRNQYRIPDFFRMDLSFNIEPTHRLTLLTHSYFSVGVYNLTGRKNAYSVYYIAEKGVLNGYRMAIFGAPIPYISYNIKF